MRFTKVHLLALAFVAGVLPAVVSADGWFSRAGETKEVTLTDLLKSPRDYQDVEVKFKVYFDAPGQNYNPYFTRFNEDTYGNFSAYSIDARLYDRRDYPRPYPFFFATKLDKTWKKMKDIDRLRIIKIHGVVRDVFKGQPWIEVLDWSRSSGGLSEEDVRDVIRADAHYVAGKYEEAARLYDRADSSSLPAPVRADLQRRLGDACFRAGEYDDAQDAYETGLKCAPDNAVLKQGAEASEAARARAKASRRGETVDGETPEVAPAEQPVIQGNGVDEVIRLLEDPAKVEDEVANWRLELEARAAALNGGTPGATEVSGTDPVPPAQEPAPVPAPVATPEETPVAPEPTVEPEPVPAEGCATPAPEGCAEAPEGCSPEQPAEQPAPEQQPTPEQPAEEPAEEPAPEQPSGCAEQPAEQPAEQAPEQPAEGSPEGATEAGEQPEGTPEGHEACAEEVAPEPEPGTGESACGGAGSPEGCGQSPESGEPACGSEPAGEETIAVPSDERVVWVAGQMLKLPRLPFFGCEDVTDDDLRGIIEEVVESPETDE